MGLAGVEIASAIGGRSLADERFLGFFAEAGRLGTAIFGHAMPVLSDRLPGPAIATFGVGVEGSLAAAALITGGSRRSTRGCGWRSATGQAGSRRCCRGPSGSGAGPGTRNRRRADAAVLLRLAGLRPPRHPVHLIDMIGPDRLLVGSDFPAMPREEPAGRTLRSMGLADAVLADITWHNCFRFLGLSEPEGRGKHTIDAQ